MLRRTATAAAVLALLAAGCGGDEPAPRAAAPTALRVQFHASDGEPVRGVYRPAGDAAPAVVLVNGLVGGPDQWDAFTPALHDAGFATLAYDGRGGVDETELVKEVRGAVDFLRRRRDVDAQRLGIVGSSVGASTAVLAMTTRAGRDLRAAVALSPPAAPAFDALRAAHRYHPRDVLFVSDLRERPTVRPLTRGAIGARTVESEMAGHGVALLDSEGYREVALDWLEQHLR
jgi:alpha-beta hydrolase superfamily lysophospholipase